MINENVLNSNDRRHTWKNPKIKRTKLISETEKSTTMTMCSCDKNDNATIPCARYSRSWFQLCKTWNRYRSTDRPTDQPIDRETKNAICSHTFVNNNNINKKKTDFFSRCDFVYTLLSNFIVLAIHRALSYNICISFPHILRIEFSISLMLTVSNFVCVYVTVIVFEPFRLRGPAQ